MNFEFSCGLIPFIIFNIVLALSFIINIVFGALAVVWGQPVAIYGSLFGLAGLQIAFLYTGFALPAFITILRANDRINLTTKNKIIGVTTYFIYFYDFALAFLDGLFHPKKRTTWTRIKHTGEVTNKDLTK